MYANPFICLEALSGRQTKGHQLNDYFLKSKGNDFYYCCLRLWQTRASIWLCLASFITFSRTVQKIIAVIIGLISSFQNSNFTNLKIPKIWLYIASFITFSRTVQKFAEISNFHNISFERISFYKFVGILEFVKIANFRNFYIREIRYT